MGTETQQFDYIVVGAGSAGCLLANRLSKNPSHSVLLLEAGGNDNNPMISMPIGYTRLMFDLKYSNLYKTQHEETLGRPLSVPRGRVLGGCSSINGMLYMRGQPEDYDEWAALPGCRGWSHKEILPYFKKSENFELGDATEYHSKGGELNVTNVKTEYPISEAYVEAAMSLGIPRNDDVNGQVQEGIGYTQVNMKDGKRCSSSTAFLNKEVRTRPNLTIQTNAWARRVLFDGKKAIGIEYEDKKVSPHIVNVRKEIILSAGTYNSSVLLEMSGIGRADVLKSLGVEPVHLLEGVGENLQDHFQAWVQHGVKTKRTLGEDGKFPRVILGVLKYMFGKKGPLAFAAANVFGFIPSKDGGRPIFQIHFTPGAGSMDEAGNMVASQESGVNSTVSVIRPTSRGHVHAKSMDPKVQPEITHNYLSTEHDQKLSIEGFKLQREIYAAAPFQEHATHELVPGDEVQTDEEILDFWKSDGMSLYHPVGSAKMGDASDPMAVVDNRLRVHGIERLRVIDASIFPNLPSGNTHAPVVAVAEKGADLILQDS